MRATGPVISLSIAVTILGVALTVSMITAKVGADRWTRTDHQDYVQTHDDEKHKLVDTLLSDHSKVHKEEDKEIKAIGNSVNTIHEDVAVLQSTVNRMERDIQEIKALVLKVERNGSH